MAKMTKGPSLTAGKGKIGCGKMASAPQPQLSMSNSFAQKLMSKGSFGKPSTEPKQGASNFPGQGRADSMPMGEGLKRGHTNFGK